MAGHCAGHWSQSWSSRAVTSGLQCPGRPPLVWGKERPIQNNSGNLLVNWVSSSSSAPSSWSSPFSSSFVPLAWHLGPFVGLIETETCLGAAVCCFNSRLEGFFSLSLFVFLLLFLLLSQGDNALAEQKLCAGCSLILNKTLIKGRWDFLVTAFKQRAKVAH